MMNRIPKAAKRAKRPAARAVFLLLFLTVSGALALAPGCGARKRSGSAAGEISPIGPFPEEWHLANIRQLTFGGENAEAYFSPDGRWLVFQSTRDSFPCDQIFRMTREGKGLQLISTGRGRTTCAYFLAGGKRILYASTHLADPACPPPPDRSRGYVWPIHAGYDLFTCALDGSDLVRLTDAPGYDAEATVGGDGRIVFTSMRDGDPEIYTMSADGSNLRRLTHEDGYDGGAFLFADGKRIVYRAHHPTDPQVVDDYRTLLAQGLIRPTVLELFVMNSDGSDKRQITHNGKANFCPFPHPSGERVIFASNLDDPNGRIFELYLIHVDGSGLERITYSPSFDGFPMWSPDGKRLVWCSNRGGAAGSHETNVFIADWLD